MDSSFRLSVLIVGNEFSSFIEDNLITFNTYKYSKTYDVSEARNYTFFIKNKGIVNACNIILEISPDNIDWINGSALIILKAGQLKCLVARFFIKYARIGYKSFLSGRSTNIKITLQQQK